MKGIRAVLPFALTLVLAIVTIAMLSPPAAGAIIWGRDTQPKVTVWEVTVPQVQDVIQTNEIWWMGPSKLTTEIVWSRRDLPWWRNPVEITADIIWSKRDIPWWRPNETNIIRTHRATMNLAFIGSVGPLKFA